MTALQCCCQLFCGGGSTIAVETNKRAHVWSEAPAGSCSLCVEQEDARQCWRQSCCKPPDYNQQPDVAQRAVPHIRRTLPGVLFGRVSVCVGIYIDTCVCEPMLHTDMHTLLKLTSRSSAKTRPDGTDAPTQLSPGCFCWCTPSRSRRGQGASCATCTAGASCVPGAIVSATRPANASKPICSMSHMRRVFWRSARGPWSLRNN